jgi:choline dehydrogenase-like flavoprotein
MIADHDVLIIGSGASGGMMARQLTAKGIKCLMLDAGPPVDFERDRVNKYVYDLPYRGFPQPGRFPHITQANEFNGNVWADEKLNPYTYDPDSPYYWVRVRRVGGRTLVWGRASWRLSDFEFKCKDHDGFGENWPISYADLAPYYDQVEPILRVTGRKEGLPQLPDGIFIEDGSRPSDVIQRFTDAAKKKGVPTTQPRRATGQMASSVNLMLPDAVATGNLKIIPNAVVREITKDPKTGLANGAHFIDRQSKRDYHVTARVVVVGAGTLETTRLLLNSGLANSSGEMGRYLFDQFYVKQAVTATTPGIKAGGSGYIPRFRNVTNKESKFIRGYAFDFSSGGTPPAEYIPLYGEALRKKLASLEGTFFQMTTMGEVLPRRENFVRIDKSKVDAWGIPVLHIQHRYTDNEFEMAKDATNVGSELCEDAGFQVLARHWQMVPPGESIHELGTCRMGADPKKSVLNAHSQTHDIKNLFVVDGSAFVSGGSQNPTLTICALSMRAADYIADGMRTRDL